MKRLSSYWVLIMKKKKKKVSDEVTVRVQNMFPNCQKYEPCCKESGYEETMKKVKKIHNYKELIDDMLESIKEKKEDDIKKLGIKELKDN